MSQTVQPIHCTRCGRLHSPALTAWVTGDWGQGYELHPLTCPACVRALAAHHHQRAYRRALVARREGSTLPPQEACVSCGRTYPVGAGYACLRYCSQRCADQDDWRHAGEVYATKHGQPWPTVPAPHAQDEQSYQATYSRTPAQEAYAQGDPALYAQALRGELD